MCYQKKGMNNSYFALLRQRPDFRYLWLASVISLMGDWFNTIASVMLVSRYTDTGVAVGALFLARALPPFLLGPVAGVVADRFNRKTILIATDVLRAFIVLGFLLVNSAEWAWLIYTLTIGQSVVSAFFEPTSAAILPALVQGDDELLAANTLSSATWSAMLAIGAAIGGVTAALFGANTALVIDALTFFISAALVFRMATPPAAGETAASGNGWADFVNGLRYVKQHREVGLLTLVKALGQIGSTDILIAIYAERVFPMGEEGALTLGLMFAAAGVGALLGPIIGNALTDGSARTLQQAIGAGFIALATGWLIFGWSPSLPIAMLGLVIRFMGGSLNWTYSNVLLQMKAPDRLLGRVFALDFSLFTLAMALAVWLTGVGLDQMAVTPRQISLIFATGSLFPIVFWFVANRLKKRQPIQTEQGISQKNVITAWSTLFIWLAGLTLLLLLAVSPVAAQQPQGHQIYLPLITKAPGGGGGGGGGGSQSANFFLPNKPGGSIVTTVLPKIAVDPAGGVHAVYAANMPDSSGARPAYYAYCPANCTRVANFSMVSLGDLMSYAELGLDPQGHPRLLLVSGDSTGQQQYVYGECNGNCTTPAQWTLALVATGQLSFFPSPTEQKMDFALDPQGRPRFVHYANPFGQPDGGTFYMACEGSCANPANWTATKLSDDEWKNPSLAFTQAGRPRLAFTFTDPNTYAPLVAYLECDSTCTNAANWNGAVLVGAATSGAMSDNVFALRLDKNDRVRLALYPGSGDGGDLPPNRLYYLSCNANCLQAGTWNAVDAGFPNYGGEGGLDLAFDPQNRPRIAYRIPAPTDELAYAWCNANCETSAQGWQSQIIPTTAAAQQEFPFDPMQGCPSPTCIPPIPPCASAFWDAGYWPSLAFDAAGNPRLAFDLKHQHGGGGCTAGSFVRFARFAIFDQP